jgi:hypothetical protein
MDTVNGITKKNESNENKADLHLRVQHAPASMGVGYCSASVTIDSLICTIGIT